MWERFGLRGARLAEAIGPQFFPPASTAKVLPGTHLVAQGSIMNFSPNFPCRSVIMSAVAGVKKVKKVTKTTSKKVKIHPTETQAGTTCGLSSQEGFDSKVGPQRGYV